MRVSVQQFQAIHEISMSNLEDIDKAVAYVTAITGKSILDIEKMPIDKFNKICAEVVAAYSKQHNRSLENDKPQRYIKANGEWYEIHYDLTKPPFTAGRYVEVATFSRDLVKNLNKVMASIVTPVKFNWLTLRFVPIKDLSNYSHERIAIDMLHADINVVYHSCLFFYAVFNELIKHSKNYLIKTAKNKVEAEQLLLTLTTTLDGFIPAQWYQKWKNVYWKMSGT